MGKIIEFEAGESTDISMFQNIQDNDIFPDLLWILRDFSLKNDHENNILTPNEYLEKILNISSTTNLNKSDLNYTCSFEDDEIKENLEKNKIRENIKKYFTKRECYTIVSPINDDSEMKDLDRLQDEKLKPEFLSQVLMLRKKLMNNCKIKTFKGLKLNPENFLRIIKDYIHLFNSGNIPKIDSIWNNLCNHENQKAFEEAESIYIDTVKKNITKKPLNELQLEQLHDQAKEKCLNFFKRNSLGNISDLIKKTLKKKITENLLNISKANDDDNMNEILNFVKINFAKLENKLNNNEINTLEEIQNEINILEEKIILNYANTKTRTDLILDFKHKIIYFGSNYLINKFSNDVKIKNEKFEQDKKTFLEIKQNLENELKIKNENINKFDLQINSLNEEIQKSYDNLENEKIDKQKIISSYEEKLSKIKSDNIIIISDLQEKITIVEKKNIELELKSYEIRENYEKEKASIIIKNEYLNKTIEELNKREQDSKSEKKNKILENLFANKTSVSNYENQIIELNNEINLLKDKISESENKVFSKDNILEINAIKFNDLQVKYDKEKFQASERLLLMKSSLEVLKNKTKEEMDEKDLNISNLKNQMKEKENEFLNKIKITEENLKSQIFQYEKDLSLEKQKNNFLELKCEEYTYNADQVKKNYENMVLSMEKKITNDTETKEKKTELEFEKKQLEEYFEKTKNQLKKEIENLNEKISKMEKSNKENSEILEKQIKDYNDILEKNKYEIKNLEYIKIKLEEEKLKISEDLNLKIIKLSEEYEKKFEENEKNHRKNLENSKIHHDETLANYKILYETEKIRLEEKNKEEKQKYEKKTKILQEDYETKIIELEKENKNDVNYYKEEYDELDQDYQKYIFKTDTEMIRLNSIILNLESEIKEGKDNINNIQYLHNVNIDKKNDNFNSERKEFLIKIETLNKELNLKDQEIATLKFRKDNLEKENKDYEFKNKQETEYLEKSLKELQNENDFLQKKSKQAEDENAVKKLEHIRESELLKQQIEFFNKKLDEHIRLKEENEENYEMFLSGTRKQVEVEFISKIESLKKDKEELTAKLSTKKKELRDLEQAFLKQTCMHEKEKQNLNEKISNFDQKKKEMIESYQSAIDAINHESLALREDYEKEIREEKNNLKKLKEKISELEKTNSSNQHNKTNMKNKFGTLENQLEENKKFISEVQVKFDNILNNQINKSRQEKINLENEYKQKIINIQKQYEDFIRNLEDDFNRKIYEMQKENEDLEEELNALSRITQNNLTSNDPNKISKKISELLSIQENLRKDLNQTKFDKEKKISELISQFDREKETLNVKIFDYEYKFKELEEKISKLQNFSTINLNQNNSEYEKEKYKWKFEKDNFNNKIFELNLKYEKLENSYEILLKEKENTKINRLDYSPIHNLNFKSNFNNGNSYLKGNSKSNSILGGNGENNVNKKNSFMNNPMNMSSPIGKQEPNLFSDNSEIGEYNIYYDMNSPQLNVSQEKNEYFVNQKNYQRYPSKNNIKK